MNPVWQNILEHAVPLIVAALLGIGAESYRGKRHYRVKRVCLCCGRALDSEPPPPESEPEFSAQEQTTASKRRKALK